MKYHTKLQMIIFCLCLCAGCTTLDKPKDNDHVIGMSTHSTLSDSLQAFSISSFSRLWKQGENLLYSPYSAYLTLALCSNDAHDETQQELLHALCYKGDIQKLNQQLADTHTTLTQDSIQLHTAIWKDQTVEMSQSLQDAATYYSSEIITKDFSQPSLKEDIHQWVQANTNKKLSFQQPITRDTAMIYINTLYMQDRWSTPFEKRNTKTETFTTADQKQIKTSFMHNSFAGYYMDKENYEAVSLPLKEGNQMLFYLPKNSHDPLEILEDPAWISQFHKDEDVKMIDIALPSFTTKQDQLLTEMLTAMGVKHALSKTEAQFSSKRGNDPLYIDNIHQGSYLHIDEEGVEAAAYTDISMETGCALLESVHINFNRPFLYAIVSSQNIPLFIGYLQNPTI